MACCHMPNEHLSSFQVKRAPCIVRVYKERTRLGLTLVFASHSKQDALVYRPTLGRSCYTPFGLFRFQTFQDRTVRMSLS